MERESKMILKDNLEIILITYNRKEHLQKTFNQIFADDSPIKNLQMTILDNKSTDGTSELIEEYVQRFPNIKHIIHKKNIGGNANIVRAFETASKKYFWILCDDDSYNWTHWAEVVEGLNQDYDAVMVERNSPSSDIGIPVIINELGFIPAAIYKTENLTEDVIHNAYINILNYMPHLALTCYLVNEKKRILVPEHTIITQGWELKSSNEYVKGFEKFAHTRASHVNLFSSFINSYQMIKDKNLRYECCNELWIGKSFAFSMQAFMTQNNFYPYNICDIFNGINFWQKIIFLAVILKYIVFDVVLKILFYNILQASFVNDRLKIRLFGIPLIQIKFKKKSKSMSTAKADAMAKKALNAQK